MRWLHRLTDALVPTGSILDPEDTAPFDGSRYDSAGGYEIVAPRARVCRGRGNCSDPHCERHTCLGPWGWVCERCARVVLDEPSCVDSVIDLWVCANGCTWTPCGRVEGCSGITHDVGRAVGRPERGIGVDWSAWVWDLPPWPVVYHGDAPNPCGSEG